MSFDQSLTSNWRENMENTSGQGAAAIVPPEVDRWNWGAFFLNWIWGIGNNTFIAFLMFVPLVNLIMIFLLGAMGSSWAWRNKRWESVDQFRAIQRSWAKWGAIVWVAFVTVFVALFFAISAAFKSSEAFKLALSQLEAHEQAVRLIGKPASTGMPMGEFQINGPNGSANLSFSVEGPNGKGKVYVQATKTLGQWKLDRLILEQDDTGRRLDLTQ